MTLGQSAVLAAARRRYLTANRRRWLDGQALLGWSSWRRSEQQAPAIAAGLLEGWSGSRALGTPELLGGTPSGLVARPAAAVPAGPSEMDARERLQRVALHESAHAVVAHLVGCRVTSIDIAPAPTHPAELAGYTDHRIGEADPVGRVATTLAGYMFDLLSGRSADDAIDGGASDRASAAAAAARIDPRNPDGIVMRAQGVAGQLLDRHWAAVEGLAGQLLVSDRLEGDDLVDELEASLDGLRRGEWIVRRRAATDAAGLDPVAREAAWASAGRRWYGSARPLTQELYQATPAFRAEREYAEMMSRREAIESAARAKEGSSAP